MRPVADPGTASQRGTRKDSLEESKTEKNICYFCNSINIHLVTSTAPGTL